jgi:hypothetical protein
VFKLASRIVREGPLEARVAAGWVVRLCLALDAMHRLRACHGRISARAIQMVSGSCDDAGFLLDASELVDDLCYQSPERLDGGSVSPTDDTWAAGVLLYHAVTGALPFGEGRREQLLARVRKVRPTPLFKLGLTLPHLQGVIDAVLCPDPRRRTRTVASLRAQLVQCMPSTRVLPELALGKAEPDTLADEASDGAGPKHDDGLDERATLPREAARIVVVDEDTGRLPTQVMRPRGAPPASELPASQLPSEVPASSSGLDSQPVSYWADEDSEIEVSYETVDTVAMMDESSEAPTSVRRSTAAPRPVTTLASPLTLATEDTGLGAGPRSPWGRMLGAAAFVGLGAAAGYLLLGPRDTAPTDGAPSAVALEARLDAGSSPSAPAPSPVAPSSAGARPPRPGGDLPGCVRAIFPSGTFGTDPRKPRFDFVCSQRDARKGAQAMNTQLVLGASPGAVTEGMRDWARLGWYEMAVFASAKVLCCEAPAALATRTSADQCALDRALEQLGQAAVRGEDAALDSAMAHFKDTATCLLRQGGAGPYVALGVPGRAPDAAFARFVARIRRASAR